jgi:hypothetical protein
MSGGLGSVQCQPDNHIFCYGLLIYYSRNLVARIHVQNDTPVIGGNSLYQIPPMYS